MRTEKPVIQRVYITATDPDSRKSKSITIYNSTPDQVIDVLNRAAEDYESHSVASADSPVAAVA